MEWWVSLGRRRLYHTQRAANCAQRSASDLVFARFAVAVFPAGLYNVSHRARAVGYESHRLSLDQPYTSRGERVVGVACSSAFERAGFVARGGDLCPASGASGISCVDYGTQKCSDGVLLSSDASRLDRIY